MYRIYRKGLAQMPLAHLKRLEAAVAETVRSIEALPAPRDVDIADSFSGESGLVAALLDESDVDRRGCRYRTQTIYCGDRHCPRCPHGPFIFRYRRGKRGRLSVTFSGWPAFDTAAVKACYRPVTSVRGRLRRARSPGAA